MKYETQNIPNLYRHMDTYSYRPSKLHSKRRPTTDMTKHKQQHNTQQTQQQTNNKQTRDTTRTTKHTTKHNRIKPPLFYDSVRSTIR